MPDVTICFELRWHRLAKATLFLVLVANVAGHMAKELLVRLWVRTFFRVGTK